MDKAYVQRRNEIYGKTFEGLILLKSGMES